MTERKIYGIDRYVNVPNPPDPIIVDWVRGNKPYINFEDTFDAYNTFGPFIDMIHAADLPYDERERRRNAQAFLGLNDRFYLLTALCSRADAVHPWLFDRCREIEEEPDGHIDLWSRFHYKMIRVDEPVATPAGWKKHGDLEPGDFVFGVDGKPTQVIARTQVWTDGDCYKITFDKGYSVVVGGDHLWTVNVSCKTRLKGGGRGKRKQVTISTRELREIVARKAKTTVRPNVELCRPLDLPHADLTIEPYTLGAWLGDGTSANGNLTCGDPEIFSRIETHYTLGENKTPDRTSQCRKIVGLSALLNNAGIRGNGKKRIPPQYLRGSIEQRTALLQGLMDTDGHCDTRGTATFVNINEALAKDVFDLAAGLGLKPGIRKHVGTHNGEPYPFYHVSFQARAGGIQVFGLARKQRRATTGGQTRSSYHGVVSVEPVASEACSCIQVDRPNGLYLVGKHYIPTHNSTIITFAGVIQEVLRNPEIKVAIFSVVKPIAAAFLSQIKEEFENNDFLKSVYRDVLYENPRGLGADGRPAKWGLARGITVKRKSRPKEATIEAHGMIDGQPTSRHFDLHVYDDMVTQDYLTEESIKKTTERWEMADNLGSHLGVRKWMPGTRYHFADSYSVVLERGSMKPRIYPATHNGKLDGKPVFLSQKRWDEIKRDQRSTVSAQCLLNPIAGNEATFNAEMLRGYDVFPAVMNVYILVDPSKGSTQRSDRTAIAVIGIDGGGNKYLIDGFRHRMKLKERWDHVKRLKEKWERHPGVQMVRVGWERYGKDAEIEAIEDMQLRERNVFEIEELNTPRQGRHSKNDRIERLEPDFREGRFLVPGLIHNPNKGGRCLWVLWDDALNRIADEKGTEKNPPGQIVHKFIDDALTKRQQNCAVTAQRHRIVEPIKRADENKEVYDLTRCFMDEFLRHPFASHDDLIDAVSRIYDIDPQIPQIFEAASTEGLPEDDYEPQAV